MVKLAVMDKCACIQTVLLDEAQHKQRGSKFIKGICMLLVMKETLLGTCSHDGFVGALGDGRGMALLKEQHAHLIIQITCVSIDCK